MCNFPHNITGQMAAFAYNTPFITKTHQLPPSSQPKPSSSPEQTHSPENVNASRLFQLPDSTAASVVRYVF
ncbi:hypothetical protein Hanom_Chr08g00704261 [Helianthus anomalus]